MEYLLISSCLLGNNVKYNGKNNYIKEVELLKNKYNLIVICPEIMGGLPIPRIPSEVLNDKVINKEGIDVTSNFIKGKDEAIKLVKKYNIKKALLKEGSPSCGSKYIYDGTFSGKKIEGYGITTKALKELGLDIYNENEIEKLL